MNRKYYLLCSLIVFTLISPDRAGVDADSGIAAITNPSADITLSFVQPGRISDVLVKEGESVNLDQVLIKQNDSVDQARLAQFEADSKKTTNIDAAKVSLSQKRVDLQKLEIAASRDAATELEVQHAKLDVKIAELSLELAVFEREQAVRKYGELKLQIDNMTLKSPTAGSVEKVEVEVGESVNALDSVVRIVRTDPLWIDVPVPLTDTAGLRGGAAVEVRFPGPNQSSTTGKIIFIAAVADAGSGTLRVKVEVPNNDKRPAGEQVTVIFPSSQD